MEKTDLFKFKLLINEYGAAVTLKLFAQALKECADEQSDLGLKEQARETAEVAELLPSSTYPKLRLI